MSKDLSTKPVTATNFKLFIPRHFHDDIMYWLVKSKNEVSGFGALEYDEEGNYFWVKDIMILKQKVTPTSTELDAHAIGKAMYHFRDTKGGMKWHWHTHPNMNTFWSQDDMEIIRSYGQQGWIMASVFNEKHEMRSAFYCRTEVLGKPHDVFQDNIETHLYHNIPEERKAWLDQQYAENVSEDKPETKPTLYSAGSGWTAYGGDLWDDDRAARIIDSKGYDQHGWKVTSTDYLYNPMRDLSLKDDIEKAEALLDLDEVEFAAIEKDDPHVTHFLNRVLATKEDK